MKSTVTYRVRLQPISAMLPSRNFLLQYGCLLICCLFLIACGGGGNSSDNNSGEMAFTTGLGGPGDVNNYFPYQPGNLWVYRGMETSVDGSFTYSNVAYVDRVETIQGLDAVVLVETNALAEGPTDSYLFIDDFGLATLGTSDTESPDALLSPYWNVLFSPLSGNSFVQLDRTNILFSEDLDEDGIGETADIHSVVEVLGISPISSQLGDYPEALQLNLETRFDLRLSSDGSQLMANSIESLYFVRDIGLLQQTVDVEIDSETTTTQETLVAYQLAGVSTVGMVPVVEKVTEQQVENALYFIYNAVKGVSYQVAITGADGDSDLLSLLPNSCVQSNTSLSGASPNDCLLIAETDRLIFAVQSDSTVNFVLSVNESVIQSTPGDENRLDLVIDQPFPGQVGPRGRSRYAATGLVPGLHTVSLFGLSADADLHVYGDDTYSLELDCTLRAPGDVSSSPQECTVDNVSSMYFDVSSGELNGQGASYYLLVH